MVYKQITFQCLGRTIAAVDLTGARAWQQLNNTKTFTVWLLNNFYAEEDLSSKSFSQFDTQTDHAFFNLLPTADYLSRVVNSVQPKFGEWKL